MERKFCLVNKNNDLSLKFPMTNLYYLHLVLKVYVFFCMTFVVILKQTSHGVCLLRVESFRSDVIHTQ